jgi:hypothetical protein
MTKWTERMEVEYYLKKSDPNFEINFKRGDYDEIIPFNTSTDPDYDTSFLKYQIQNVEYLDKRKIEKAKRRSKNKVNNIIESTFDDEFRRVV